MPILRESLTTLSHWFLSSCPHPQFSNSVCYSNMARGGRVEGWALSLASDPVVQQGALLLHNCLCVSAGLRCAVVRLTLQLLMVSIYVFLIPCHSKLVAFKQLLESPQLSCCASV